MRDAEIVESQQASEAIINNGSGIGFFRMMAEGVVSPVSNADPHALASCRFQPRDGEGVQLVMIRDGFIVGIVAGIHVLLNISAGSVLQLVEYSEPLAVGSQPEAHLQLAGFRVFV